MSQFIRTKRKVLINHSTDHQLMVEQGLLSHLTSVHEVKLLFNLNLASGSAGYSDDESWIGLTKAMAER